MNLQLFNTELAINYLVNAFTVIALIRGVFIPKYRKWNLVLTFLAFNSIVFFITSVLVKTEISTGAAFGLFAVFSILRYRTEGMSTVDMTYLFLCTALGLTGSLLSGYWLDYTIICLVILMLAIALDSSILGNNLQSKEIVYDNLKLVQAEDQAPLLQDLKLRTGLNIEKISVDSIDLVKESCVITVYYRA